MEGSGMAKLGHDVPLVPPGLVREIVITTARVLLFTVVIVLGLLPLPYVPKTRTDVEILIALFLAIWGLIFIFVFRWQLQRIKRAPHPQTQMIEALLVIFVLFLAIFTKVYHIMSLANPHTFSEPLSYFSAFYFSMTVLSTVGFGDIAPLTIIARTITMLQMALDFVLLGVAVRIVSGAATRTLEARRIADDDQ